MALRKNMEYFLWREQFRTEKTNICQCKGLEIPLGYLQQSLCVDFIAMEGTGYVLCPKRIFLKCVLEEFCGGIEERCRNKSYVGAINKVPRSQGRGVDVRAASHKDRSAALAVLCVKCQGGIPMHLQMIGLLMKQQFVNTHFLEEFWFFKWNKWCYIARHHPLTSGKHLSLPPTHIFVIIILELSLFLSKRRIFHCIICWVGGHVNRRVSQRERQG